MPDKKSQITSILFAATRPVKLAELAKSLEMDKDQVLETIEQLKKDLLETGINLIEKDEKCQLITNPSNAKVVANFLNAELREKLTEAALETLAIIVYKQPVSRAEIEAIRGVNSQYILRQLLIRGMIEKTTHPEDARRLVYKTTLEFMTHLGIRDLKELPDFEDLTKAVSLPAEQITTLAENKEVAVDNLPLQNSVADKLSENELAGTPEPTEKNSGNEGDEDEDFEDDEDD